MESIPDSRPYEAEALYSSVVCNVLVLHAFVLHCKACFVMSSRQWSVFVLHGKA